MHFGVYLYIFYNVQNDLHQNIHMVCSYIFQNIKYIVLSFTSDWIIRQICHRFWLILSTFQLSFHRNPTISGVSHQRFRLLTRFRIAVLPLFQVTKDVNSSLYICNLWCTYYHLLQLNNTIKGLNGYTVMIIIPLM